MLANNARLAVASFLGLSLTVTEYRDAGPSRVVLQFTLPEDHVDPGDVVTSLRVSELTEAGGDQANIQVVLTRGHRAPLLISLRIWHS